MLKLEEIESQDQLEKMVAKMVEDATGGLVSKNQELLGKLHKMKDKIPDNIEEMKAAMEKLKSLEDEDLEAKGEYKKLIEKSQEQHQKEIEKVMGELEKERSMNKHLLVNDALGKALQSHNVNPVLIDSAVKILASDVSLIEEDGKRVARVGDKNIEDFVKDWSNTDVGKNFILASGNSGGGANGNGSGGGSATGNEVHWKKDTWNKTEQYKVYKQDPAEYERLCKKYPSPEGGANAQSGAAT